MIWVKYLRIKKNSDFQRLFKKGKKIFSPDITLLYFPAAKTAMGVAVSKKHGKAVTRNRIKRLLRAVFSENCGLLDKPYACILVPKIKEEYTYKSFERSLKILFKKISESGKI